MSDEYIRDILAEYSDFCMDTFYSPNREELEKHVFSRRHEKKMKKLVWSEKYFGIHIRAGYVVRRVAILAAVILSLAAANTVSAKVFGFNPWRIVATAADDFCMKTVYYMTGEDRQAKPRKARNNVPAYIPEGYRLTYSDIEEGVGAVTWKQGGREIGYTYMDMADGTTVYRNSEFEKQDEFTIEGYQAVLYTRGDEWLLEWMDAERWNELSGTVISREEMVKIAESIYEEK